MTKSNPFGMPLSMKLRIAWLLLKGVFCRHEYKLLVDQTLPDEICAWVVCHKCRRNYGHFHIPLTDGKKLAASKEVRERLH